MSLTLSPGAAFSIAYLPAKRIAHAARVDLVERNAATIDPKLKHAIEFSRKALKVEESQGEESVAKLVRIASAAGIQVPQAPRTGLAAWIDAVAAAVKPRLTTPLLETAWKAGEAARRVGIAVQLAAHISYLRCAAPDNADLRAQASEQARELTGVAAELTAQLVATELPLVISHSQNVEKFISLTSSLEPTTADGYRQLNELVESLYGSIESKVRQLDTPPPPKASSPPTGLEKALFEQICSVPSNYPLRRELAKQAALRNDPRAVLIELQTGPASSANSQQINDLIRSHPEWSARLVELGARNVKFEGGFPEEITIDSDVLIARWTELRMAAPLTRLHVRGPKGNAGKIVRSTHLSTIEVLDLDSQGLTDDDLVALAGNQHVARLRQLDLRYNVFGERGVEAIAASKYFKNLEVVNMDANPADPTDRLEYYDETNTHFVPTEAGKALEAKYGRLRWIHRS